MSADNGIYILKTKDQYRVIHTQAIENLYYSYISPNRNELVPTRIIEYFGDAKYTRKRDLALRIAHSMASNYSILEYGINIIEVNKTWNQILVEAKKLAKLELESIEHDNTLYGLYCKEKLQRIMSRDVQTAYKIKDDTINVLKSEILEQKH